MKSIGEPTALATAFFFAITALISTGCSVGSQVTDRTRLLFALLYLVVLNLIVFREPLPIRNNKDATQTLGAGTGFMKLLDNYYSGCLLLE